MVSSTLFADAAKDLLYLVLKPALSAEHFHRNIFHGVIGPSICGLVVQEVVDMWFNPLKDRASKKTDYPQDLVFGLNESARL